MTAAAKRPRSNPDWSDAHICVEKIRHVIRNRPTLEKAAALPEQCRPCLRILDSLSRTLREPEEDAIRDLVVRTQAAIEQYADYEAEIVTGPPVPPASRARQIRDRSAFWQEMVGAVDVLEKSIRRRLPG